MQYTLKPLIKAAGGQAITALEVRRDKIKDIKAAHRYLPDKQRTADS